MGYLALWDRMLSKFKRTGASLDVTHYTLSLGAAHGTTGQYAKSYSAGSTIQMVIVGRAAKDFLTGMGIFIRADAVGLTDTAVVEGDEIKDGSSTYYRVETVLPHYFGDALMFYEAQLTHLPFHA